MSAAGHPGSAQRITRRELGHLALGSLLAASAGRAAGAAPGVPAVGVLESAWRGDFPALQQTRCTS